MIEQFHPEGLLCREAPAAAPTQLAIPTIQRNSVIVLRVSRNDYDLDEMNVLRDYYSKIFPNNTVAVMFDDIEMEIVNDNSWRKRPCAEEKYDTYNYS